MARPSAYSPWRRMLLQGVLCAILVGTLALASAVTKYKIRAHRVKLNPPVLFGNMGVPLPEGWIIHAPDGRSLSRGMTLINVTEPISDNSLPPRALTIVRAHLDVPQPPAEYLLTSGLMPLAYAPSLGGAGKIMEVSATPVAGQQGGYLQSGQRIVPHPSGRFVLRNEVFATAMLPSRDLVTVRLEDTGNDLDADVALVRRIAAGITLPPVITSADTAAPRTLTLSNGVTVNIPSGFSLLPEQDTHVTERHLIRNSSPARWSRLTLVPCVFFPGVDDPETFRTMLSARDGEWIKSTLATDPSNTLRADVPLPGGLPFPRRAYLQTSPTGNALLIEFEAGSSADAAEWETLYKQVAGSATQPTGPAPVDLLAAGAKEATRLRQIGLPTLLTGLPAEQWWIWSIRGRGVGWNHLAFEPGPVTRGVVDTRLELVPGAAKIIRHTFKTSADFSQHADAVLRRDLVLGNEPVDRFKAESSLAAGRFTITLLPEPATGQAARFTPKASPELLPGPWVPMILSKLSPQEMILRTTSLPGLEAISATSYLNIRLRPTTRPATFDLDVSGTGQWITLSPSSYDFSTTVTRRLATPAEVKKAFAADPVMRP